MHRPTSLRSKYRSWADFPSSGPFGFAQGPPSPPQAGAKGLVIRDPSPRVSGERVAEGRVRGSLFRPRRFQHAPFLVGKEWRGGRVVHVFHLFLVRVQAAVEIFDKTGKRNRTLSFEDFLQ